MLKSFSHIVALVALGLCLPAMAEETESADTELPAQQQVEPQSRHDFEAGVLAFKLGEYRKAYELWFPYAEAGDPAALRNIGHLFAKGLGVEQSDEKAFRHYHDAAVRGLVSAKGNLALAYYKGTGTEKDLHEARYWFEQAAMGGSGLSAFHLAHMQEHGLGGAVDKQTALEWYAVAVLAHIPPATERLADLISEVKPPHSIRAYRSQGRPPPGAARGGANKREPFEPPSIVEQFRPGALR